MYKMAELLQPQRKSWGEPLRGLTAQRRIKKQINVIYFYYYFFFLPEQNS